MKFKLAFLLLFVISFLYGQGNYRASNYSLVIKGTSNLHAWDCKVNEVRANGAMTADASGLKAINSLYVEIPVKTIKSSKGGIMDNKMYNALKADNYANITYKLDKVNSLNKRGDGYDINTTGYLTISGTTQKIDLYVWGQVGGDQSITFKGSKKLKMTDFNVNPPTALMGTLTTGDEVEIIFQVTLKQ